MTAQVIIVVLIFTMSIILIATETIHKTVASLSGAALMFMYLAITDGLTFDVIIGVGEGNPWIDLSVIAVILGMMITVEVVKTSGLFQYITIKAVKAFASSPMKLLMMFTVLTAILSSLLENITALLIIGVLTLTTCRSLDLDPVPFLVSEAVATKAGGIPLLVSAVPNLLVGEAANLTFVDYFIMFGPIGFFMIAITTGYLAFIYRNSLGEIKEENLKRIMLFDEKSVVTDKSLFYRTTILFILIIIGFITIPHLDAVSIVGAILMLVLSGVDPEHVLHKVEWSSIFFFMGLFVMVEGLIHVGALTILADILVSLASGNEIFSVISTLWIMGITSSIVDDITLATMMVPVIKDLIVQTGFSEFSYWRALILAANLGAVFTHFGSPSTIIAFNMAKRAGATITFKEWTKAGVVMGFIYMTVSSIYLLLTIMLGI